MEDSNRNVMVLHFKAAIGDLFKQINLSQSHTEMIHHIIEFLLLYTNATKVNIFEFFTKSESILVSSTEPKESQYVQVIHYDRQQEKVWVDIRENEIVYQLFINPHYYIELYFEVDPKYSKDLLLVMIQEVDFLMKITTKISKQQEEEQRYRLLFRLTNKFYNTIHLDELLQELFSTITMLFPKDTLTIWLTHENRISQPLPIKVLDYQSDGEDNSAIESYISGEVKICNTEDEGILNMYAPLKGKQGVYGVLQISSQNRVSFSKDESSFISIVANTAGSAIENAQIFTQYKNYVTDLEFINETGQVLNSCKKMTEIVSFSVKKIIDLCGAEEVGYYIKEDEKGLLLLEGSTDLFQAEELPNFLHVLLKRVENGREAIYIGDFQNSYPDITSPYQSVLVFPLLQGGDFKGVLFVVHSKKYFFPFETFKLLESFTAQTTLSLMNTTLREELEEMVTKDYLTKLYSRTHLDRVVAQSLTKDSSGVFILIDIDNFKNINDIYGHQIGDSILIQVSKTLRKHIRDHDIAARWGGEELAIYLPNATIEAGEKVTARLLSMIPNETNPKTTVSIGVSYWSLEKQYNPKELFHIADEALYEAKRRGKNQYVLASDENTN